MGKAEQASLTFNTPIILLSLRLLKNYLTQPLIAYGVAGMNQIKPYLATEVKVLGSSQILL